MKNIIIAIIIMLGITVQAQVKTGDNHTTGNSNSVLELESANKGMLPPRVALLHTTNPAPLSAHVQGMLVYNTATTGDVTPCTYVNDGTKWVSLCKSQAISANCNGFQGNWAQGAYTRTYKVTFINNSFFDAGITPATNDLTLSPASGLTVASVSPNTATAIPANGTLEVTYTFGGTLAAFNGTVITGTFSKLGISCSSTVTVGNNPPTVNAGDDQTTISPASTATFTGTSSDADGSIASIQWTQTAGPATAVIASPSSLSTGISGLSILGTYVFRLTATDDIGATAYDEINVAVINTFTGSGSSFTSPPPAPYNGQTAAFSTNATCTAKTISVTPCSAVIGATANDDAASTMGTEYDWADATSYVAGNLANTDNNTRALVEINKQCWYRRNANNANTAGTGTAVFYSGSTTTPYANYYGRLYTTSQAMNGAGAAFTERAQGICPAGWHIPSDCEFMFLEHSLGMSVTNQRAGGPRDGTTDQRISSVTGSNNLSGFTWIYSGQTAVTQSGTHGYIWTSTTATNRRYISSDTTGIGRDANAGGHSIRCLKD